MTDRDPKSFRDMEWLRVTSTGWFDGAVERRSVTEIEDREVGCVDNETVELVIYKDHATVRVCRMIVDKINGPDNYSCHGEYETLKSFDDFEEFKKSEWYKKALSKWKGGSADSSWMDDNYSEMDDRFLYVETKYCEIYRDWLNNHRISDTVHDLAINVEKNGGGLEITVDGKCYSTTVNELIEALEMVERIEKFGIELTDDTITIKLGSDE